MDILSTNRIYDENKERFTFLYRSFVGGDEYKKGNYLVRFSKESDQEYQARLNATPYDNQCKSIVNTYNSFLFRTCINRDYGSLVSKGLDEFIVDADFEGRSIDHFMKEVSQWAQVFGSCYVLVTKPDVNAQSLAEEEALGVRPYVSILSPLVVIDWAYERKINGQYVLSYLKYIEDINGSVHTVKEFWPDTIKTTIYDIENDHTVSEEVIENKLNLIPCVVAYADRSMVRGIGISVIDDIAPLSRFIYNALAEAGDSVRLDSHPSLVTTPECQIGTGAGAIIQVPENTDPGLKPYVLDFSGASIDSIYTIINNSIESIEKLANVGSVRATEAKQISGISREMEFMLLNARLSSLASNLELAEEQIFRLFALYQGKEYNMTIEYPSSFSVRDTGRELQEMKLMLEITTDPAIIKEINYRIGQMLEIEGFVNQESMTGMTETDTDIE